MAFKKNSGKDQKRKFSLRPPKSNRKHDASIMQETRTRGCCLLRSGKDVYCYLWPFCLGKTARMRNQTWPWPQAVKPQPPLDLCLFRLEIQTSRFVQLISLLGVNYNEEKERRFGCGQSSRGPQCSHNFHFLDLRWPHRGFPSPKESTIYH